MRYPLLVAIAIACGINTANADNSTKSAVSNVFIDDSQCSFAINLPTDSDDVNFHISAPAMYSYFAVGIGPTMTNSLMLIAYAAADDQHVIVSPRLSTGETEPPFYSGAKISLDGSSSIVNGQLVATGTCKGCRSWPGGSLTNATAHPFIFALGPSTTLTSDDLAVGLRRHIGYGEFTMNTVQASGPGGQGAFASLDSTVMTGATWNGEIESDSDRGAHAHGLVMAVASLALAPLDLLTATIFRKWPVLHMLTSIGFMAMVLGGFGVGVKISAQYIVSQKLNSAHQVLGLITVALILLLLGLGIVGHVQRRRAVTQKPHIPRPKSPLVEAHKWGGRLLWILLLVNCGLGLKFSQASNTFIIGFAVLAAGVVIGVCMILGCVYFCYRKHKDSHDDDDGSHQLASIYNHHH